MRAILEIIFKRWRHIALIVVTLFSLIMLGTFLAEPRYVSEARILVPFGREGTVPATALTQSLNVFIQRMEQVQTQIQILSSRSIVEQAIEDMKLDHVSGEPSHGVLSRIKNLFHKSQPENTPKTDDTAKTLTSTEHEALVQALMRSMTIKQQPDSEVIVLSFKHSSPEFAQLFLEQFLSSYANMKSKQSDGGSTSFFAQQTEVLKQRLQEASAALVLFKIKWGVMDPKGQQEQLMQEYGRLLKVINEKKADLVEINSALASLRTPRGKATPESVLPLSMRQDSGFLEAQRNIAALEARSSRLYSEIGPNHPEAPSLKIELERLRSVVYDQAEQVLSTRSSTLTALVAELEQQQADLDATMQELTAKSLEMESLQARVDVLVTALEGYGEKQETSRAAAAMDAAHINLFQVIQAPTLPYAPISPVPSRNFAFGLVFSLLVGLGYAFACERFSDTINSIEVLKRYLPDNLQSMFLPLITKAPGMENIHMDIETGQMLLLPERHMVMLVRKFLYNKREKNFPASIMCTGASKGIGASTVAFSLAKFMRDDFGLKVLLVSTEFKRTAVTDTLERTSFASWLIGEHRDRPASFLNDFLPAGMAGTDTVRSILSLTQEDLANLRGNYDMVIFDSPPVHDNSVTFQLSSLVEKVLLMVEYEQTNKVELAETLENFSTSGATLLGIVVNKHLSHIPPWLASKLG